jgi:hypothetical protein
LIVSSAISLVIESSTPVTTILSPVKQFGAPSGISFVPKFLGVLSRFLNEWKLDFGFAAAAAGSGFFFGDGGFVVKACVYHVFFGHVAPTT